MHIFYAFFRNYNYIRIYDAIRDGSTGGKLITQIFFCPHQVLVWPGKISQKYSPEIRKKFDEYFQLRTYSKKTH